MLYNKGKPAIIKFTLNILPPLSVVSDDRNSIIYRRHYVNSTTWTLMDRFAALIEFSSPAIRSHSFSAIEHPTRCGELIQ